jgi:hypothetical protein
MRDTQSPESIQRSIDYTQKKLDEAKETISYYEQVGAQKDLSWEQSQVELFETEIENLSTILKDGPKKLEGIKVRVTEYKGIIVVETLNSDVFDLDFSPNGGGSIGCSLLDVERLAMSQEAVDAIRKLNRVGDSIGDFMNGASDYFSWIGGAFSIKDSNCVVSRDFKMPVGYVEIENITSDKAKEEIDGNAISSNDIEYKDLEHSIWIEIRQHTEWGPKDDDPTMHEYKHSDFHTVEVKIHKKYLGEADLNILNSPEGCVYPMEMYHGDKFGREYKLTDEEYKEIIALAQACFEGMEGKYKGNYGWTTSGYVIPKDKVMSFVNGLFAVGFDNNIMNPRMDYWRMSMQATTSEIKKALQSFKRA